MKHKINDKIFIFSLFGIMLHREIKSLCINMLFGRLAILLVDIFSSYFQIFFNFWILFFNLSYKLKFYVQIRFWHCLFLLINFLSKKTFMTGANTCFLFLTPRWLSNSWSISKMKPGSSSMTAINVGVKRCNEVAHFNQSTARSNDDADIEEVMVVH